MAADPPSHTAGPQLLGYLYQVDVALVELITRSRGRIVDPAVGLSIEKYDDVAFETGATPTEVLQTKHSLNEAKSLSDTSTDLWRTLKGWIDLRQIDEGLGDGQQAVLSLLTTSAAPDGSAAAKLRPDPLRDVPAAERILERVAQGFGNKANRS
jgi:hypothetical protein